MKESLLQTFLNKQYIKVSDQGNVDFLKKAIDEIKKKLEKKKALLPPYIMVALDPQVDESNPIITEVEKVITKKWQSFRNSLGTGDRATTYVRIVILEALYKLRTNSEIAPLIWYAGNNVFNFYKPGKDSKDLSEFLKLYSSLVETQGHSCWGLKTVLASSDISIKEVETTSTVVRKGYIVERLKAAAGPSRMEDGVNTTNNNANRYWANSNQNWVTEFGNIAGEAIATSLNSVLTDQNKSIKNIGDQINESLKGIAPILEDLSTQMFSSLEANIRRSELLWWKQALYSPSLEISYRSITSYEATLFMASDLSNMVGNVNPRSVDFLLKETLKDVFGEDIDKREKLSDIIGEIKKSKLNVVESLLNSKDEGDGRKTLLSALSNFMSDSNQDRFFNDIGISSNSEISLADLAVWIYHDVQVSKIVKTK